jgi:hypothetical protein
MEALPCTMKEARAVRGWGSCAEKLKEGKMAPSACGAMGTTAFTDGRAFTTARVFTEPFAARPRILLEPFFLLTSAFAETFVVCARAFAETLFA